MQTTVIFDIETSGFPAADLLKNAPEFKAAGNLKDPIKIAQSIQDKRDAYLADAALSAITGRVLCIGIIMAGQFHVLANDNEAEMLRAFWALTKDAKGLNNRMIGFNIHLFDLPFLIRRSWKLGVTIPTGLRRGRYWNDDLIDLRNEWQLGDRQAEGSLDTIARHFGIGEKRGNGADFAALWLADKAKATEYLENDLNLTLKVAKVFGIVA